MCCSFCLNRVCGKTRDAETNTYCSETDDLEIIITELQEKNDALEKYCAELEEEIELLKTTHKDFVIDQTPSFPEPSPPPLTPPPVQLRPPHTGSPGSGDEGSLEPPHMGSPCSGNEGSLRPPHSGSPDSGDEESLARRVPPAQRRARSTARRRSSKSKLQPQLPPRAPVRKKSVVVDKPRLRRQEREKEVQERSPSPPCDVLRLSDEEDQYEADDAVDTKAEFTSTHTGTADIGNVSDVGDLSNDTHKREDQEREDRLNATSEWEDPLNITPEREVEDRLNPPSEREERLNDAVPERKVGKRCRPAVNYREEEDQDVDDPKSAPEREVGERRRPAVNHKEQKDQDAGNSVDGGTVHCHHCEFTCLGRDGLDRHVKQRHGHLVRNGKYKCGRTVHCHHCEFTCLGQDHLDRHVKGRHGHLGRNGRYKCDWCEYSTDNMSLMTRHRLKHTGERPYRCGDCGKTFTQRGDLTTHSRTHTGQRPYVCNICGRAFIQVSHLTEHKRIHTGEKVAKCEQCGVTFSRLSYYTVHMKYHNGVKEYRCHVCSAGFVTRSELTRHTRAHTAERPYGCSFCPARFTQQSAMKQHVTRRHTHDYTHRCCQCGKGLLRPSELWKHEAKCLPSN